jgi:hypothetical protein
MVYCIAPAIHEDERPKEVASVVLHEEYPGQGSEVLVVEARRGEAQEIARRHS